MRDPDRRLQPPDRRERLDHRQRRGGRAGGRLRGAPGRGREPGARALAEVVQSSPAGYHQYRFLFLHPERFKSGERIGWGWVDDPLKERKRTKHRYEPQSQKGTKRKA